MGKREVKLKREREEREIEAEKTKHRQVHDFFWGRQCNSGRTKTKPPTSYTNAIAR
jgi:hypothetical protein